MSDPDDTIYRVSASGFADPAKVSPHPPVAGRAPFTCTICKYEYSRQPIDVVHWVKRLCVGGCGTMLEPGHLECLMCKVEREDRAEEARLTRLGLTGKDRDR